MEGLKNYYSQNAAEAHRLGMLYPVHGSRQLRCGKRGGQSGEICTRPEGHAGSLHITHCSEDKRGERLGLVKGDAFRSWFA